MSEELIKTYFNVSLNNRLNRLKKRRNIILDLTMRSAG